jgi:hypothetical protein
MTSDEFIRACEILRWSPAQVSIECGYGRRAASYWASGERVIPSPVAIWLMQRLAGQFTDPPPR